VAYEHVINPDSNPNPNPNPNPNRNPNRGRSLGAGRDPYWLSCQASESSRPRPFVEAVGQADLRLLHLADA